MTCALRAALAALAASTLLTACGNEQQEVCKKADEVLPDERVAIPDAIQEGGLQRVSGYHVRDRTGTDRLCTRLLAHGGCGGPSLKLDGPYTRFRTASGSEVTIAGRVIAETLHVVASCSTDEVSEYFKERTGDSLTFNTHYSTSFVEVLDIADTLGELSARMESKYGSFQIYVLTPAAERAIDHYVRELENKGVDVSWRRRGGSWYAARGYGDIAVLWKAGRTRHTDARWQRIDEVLEAKAPWDIERYRAK